MTMRSGPGLTGSGGAEDVDGGVDRDAVDSERDSERTLHWVPAAIILSKRELRAPALSRGPRGRLGIGCGGCSTADLASFGSRYVSSISMGSPVFCCSPTGMCCCCGWMFGSSPIARRISSWS